MKTAMAILIVLCLTIPATTWAGNTANCVTPPPETTQQKYVLFIMADFPPNGGLAVTTQVFSSADYCENAREAIIANTPVTKKGKPMMEVLCLPNGPQ